MIDRSTDIRAALRKRQRGFIINPFRFGGGGGGGGSFAPSDLGATLVGWWDANDSATITEASGEVSQWDDKSGNGNHVVQANASSKPNTLSNATWNSLTTLEFDGGDYIDKSSSSMPSGANAHTAIAIYRNASSGGFGINTKLSWGSSGTRNGRAVMSKYSSGGYDPVCGLWGVDIVGSAAKDTNVLIVVYTLDGSGNIVIRRDGTQVGSGSAGGTVVTSASPLLRFGAAAWNTSESHAGEIGEVAICDTVLSSGDIEKMEGYLAHKWGTEGYLPGGHPYKSSPP